MLEIKLLLLSLTEDSAMIRSLTVIFTCISTITSSNENTKWWKIAPCPTFLLLVQLPWLLRIDQMFDIISNYGAVYNRAHELRVHYASVRCAPCEARPIRSGARQYVGLLNFQHHESCGGPWPTSSTWGTGDVSCPISSYRKSTRPTSQPPKAL